MDLKIKDISTSSREQRKSPTPPQALSVGLACLMLAACGGGGGGSTGSGGIDPLVEDFGIAYVRQPVPDMDDADLRDPMAFNPGGDLIFRDLASPGASEQNVTQSVTGGMGDVRDVEASYDGSKLLFSLRLPEIEGAAPEDQPTWNLWEYDIPTRTLHRVIESDIIAEDGQDIAPHYLPDGRIIFSSTRQRTAKAMLTDEGKPQFSAQDEDRRGPAFVLHVLDARNGPVQASDIQQVSFNQSHDLDPTVLADGQVMFSRWDNMGSRNGIHLYKMYPDGTNLRLVYGANSHDTGTNGAIIDFTDVRETLDGGIMALVKQSTGSFQGGDIVTIDTADYVENQQPTAINSGILAGPAQVSDAYGQVRTDGLPSPGGRFNSYYPLLDGTGRILITWSQCRLMDNGRVVPCTSQLLADPNAVEAPPLYSVYLYDPGSQTQVPIFTPQEGMLYRDVVAAQPRALPPIHFDQQGPATAGFDFDPALTNEQVGILNIRSVYDFDGAYNALGGSKPDIATLADPQATLAEERPARFLRIVKAVSIPDRDLVNLNGSAFGRSSAQLMREIIGYAPIEPDGSVRVKVPANIPFAISVLDKDGKRITSRHQNWLQLRPGEIMNCSGCHAANSGTSHGRADAFTSLYSGAPIDGYVFPGTEALLVNAGDTMAEARTRVDPSALKLSVDIHYADAWTNEATAGRPKDTPFDYSYADLDPALTAPVSTDCQSNWNNLCRTVINYETHIHPLWHLPRGTAGADTCTNCHTDTDAMANPMEPDGQLDLTDGASDQNPDHFKSYHELLFGDNEQVIDITSGLLIDKQVQATDGAGNPLFQTDANGDLILDAMGNPIPVMVPIGVAPSMSVTGARASSRFFDMFTNAADPRNAVTNHVGFFSPAELKLLAEWLDIGGQYYNNPFDVPQ
jgi:hypothetical protein